MSVDTEAEKDKFFDDALFLATNVTTGQTFDDVLPILNFWAGFSPSVDVCDAHDMRYMVTWISSDLIAEWCRHRRKTSEVRPCFPNFSWWLVLKTRDTSTVYGLYRDGTELRGVYYDKPEVARAACQSTDACDYPILLGNDPLYGGLGGTFT